MTSRSRSRTPDRADKRQRERDRDRDVNGDEPTTSQYHDWLNQLLDHLERFKFTRRDLSPETWNIILDRDAKNLDAIVNKITRTPLGAVRNLDSWMISVLRSAGRKDSRDTFGPGDVGELPRRVRDAITAHIEDGRLREEDFSERCIDALSDLPVGEAIDIVNSFSAVNSHNVKNKPAYLMGMIKRHLDRVRGVPPLHMGRPPPPGPRDRLRPQMLEPERGPPMMDRRRMRPMH